MPGEKISCHRAGSLEDFIGGWEGCGDWPLRTRVAKEKRGKAGEAYLFCRDIKHVQRLCTF